MPDSTFDVIRDALAEQLGIDAATITLDSLLADELGADSLDGVELIIALEDRYNISIETEDASTIKTVRDIVTLVDASRGSAATDL
ncbi:MAG: acyl carrier protein [Coriobacteriales bacterium]|jgi:acyl carrier protein|nr:acyl carrier protein [Coriobacteriales bacterium]